MTLLLLIGALFAVAAMGSLVFLSRRSRRSKWISCANSATVTPHPTGAIARVFLSAISQRYLLAKVGAGGAGDICGATDEPLGPVADTPVIGERATIHHLGASPGSKTFVASKAIADGDRLYTTGGGKVTDTPVNNSWLVGKAIAAASGDGKPVTAIPCFPVQQSV